MNEYITNLRMTDQTETLSLFANSQPIRKFVDR